MFSSASFSPLSVWLFHTRLYFVSSSCIVFLSSTLTSLLLLIPAFLISPSTIIILLIHTLTAWSVLYVSAPCQHFEDVKTLVIDFQRVLKTKNYTVQGLGSWSEFSPRCRNHYCREGGGSKSFEGVTGKTSME